MLQLHKSHSRLQMCLTLWAFCVFCVLLLKVRHRGGDECQANTKKPSVILFFYYKLSHLVIVSLYQRL